MDSFNLPLVSCVVVAVLGTIACISCFLEVKESKSFFGAIMLFFAVLVVGGSYGLTGLQLGLFGKGETISIPENYKVTVTAEKVEKVSKKSATSTGG